MKKRLQVNIVLIAFAALILLCGCGSEPTAPTATSEPFIDEAPIATVSPNEQEQIVPIDAPLPDILVPEASGINVEANECAEIDYSNTADGYVMTRYIADTQKRLKVQVKGPTTTYTYNITPHEWETFPLSDGNGEYKVSVYENVEDTKYALVQSVTLQAELKDEFAPFLRPNQYVNYASAEDTIRLAAQLTAGLTEPLDKVAAVYSYVVENISYDKQLAATVKSGYLPVLDDVLEGKKGICFDYAALMTGMLRSQSVPCKLVVGYAGETYHAWISVYSEKDGWIDSAIYFDGSAWKRMDPTFASSANESKEIMEYIGDGTNYTEKYLY
ncbi:MAG: transglutaminase domain-containing protein [Oscillospiraceae bacterium]|nr:transglutaminase domain-containing protein [Oscillospiraceae bacterium]